eukprot:m.180443 g.180443  ORF g.180443 m.180443 type:complete len:74 (-) comp18418_c0_seq4:843-1064(-)
MGTTLLLVFFLGLVLPYFGIGMYIMRRRGAMGSEMIPHRDFWGSIPGLVKDGMLYSKERVTACVSRSSGYRRI